jgi:hypothetical protein
MQIVCALYVTNAWEIVPLQFTPMERPLFTLCATGMLSASGLAEVGASLGSSEFFCCPRSCVDCRCLQIYFLFFF